MGFGLCLAGNYRRDEPQERSRCVKEETEPARALSQMAKGTRRLYTSTRRGVGGWGEQSTCSEAPSIGSKAKFRRPVTRQATVHPFSIRGFFPAFICLASRRWHALAAIHRLSQACDFGFLKQFRLEAQALSASSKLPAHRPDSRACGRHMLSVRHDGVRLQGDQ